MTGSIDDLPDEPKELIAAISHQYDSETPSLAKGSIQGGAEFVRSGFSTTHFPLELLQNADDEQASDILFEYDSAQNQLRVFDDGDGFDKAGAVAVCQQGQSRKEHDKQIGFMGIGFKSLFEVCDRVEVHSNDYHFAFDLTAEASDGEDVPGFLLPKWIDPASAPDPEFTEETFGDDYGTVIVGHLSEAEDTILPALQLENLSASVFLFLNSLQRARIRSDGPIHRTLGGELQAAADHPNPDITHATELYTDALTDHDAETDLDTPVQVRTVRDDDNEQTYILFRNDWVPTDVPRPQFREDLMRSELFVAFRYDDTGLCPSTGSIRLSPVHSYLPLSKFDDLDIDFLLHADFDLTSNRENIQRGSPWNEAVVSQLREQVLGPVAQVVSQHDRWRDTLETVIPSQRGGDGLIHDQLLGTFTETLKETALFHPAGTDAPELVSFGDAVAVDDTVVELFGAKTIKQALGGWPVDASQHAALARLESGSLDVAAVHDVLETAPPAAIGDRSVEWFRDLYHAIAEYSYEGDGTGEDRGAWNTRAVQDTFDNEVVLTADGELEQGTLSNWKGDWRNEAIRLPLEGGYESLGDDAPSLTPYSIIHPEILCGEDGTLVRYLFEQLGAKEMSTAELLASATDETLADLKPARLLEAYAGNEDVSAPATQWLRSVPHNGVIADRLVAYLRDSSVVEPGDFDVAIQECTTQHWRRLSDETKRQTLRYLIAVEDTGDAELANIDSLPNKHGVWADPGKLVFPDEYNPKYNYEALEAAYPNVFDEHTDGFVDTALIGEDAVACREFLRELGVCTNAEEDNNIVATLSGYVGQAYATQWLLEQGVEIVETDTHGENTGWDLKDENGNYYEVKSTVDSHHGEIEIKGRQFTELTQSLESSHEYYVIAVVDSLMEEIVIEDYATAGEIMNVKESITYNPKKTDTEWR